MIGAGNINRGEGASASSDDGRERFTGEELRAVLAHYDIGRVRSSRDYPVGSRRAAKVKIVAESGEYLLKRIDPKFDIERVAASHALHELARGASVPVAALARTRDRRTLLDLDGRVYEMQEWIVGERFGREPQQALEAGAALARMHRAYGGAGGRDGLHGLPEGGFSDSEEVRSKLDAAVGRVRPALDEDQRALLDATVSTLRDHLVRADERLVSRGLPLHPSIPCHGDFHPGNTLWRSGALGAVIDFDRARREAAAAEIANAALQFSLRPRVGTDPLQWKVGLDADRLHAFIAGYRARSAVDLRSVAPFAPWLMICAVVSEAAFPIAAEGNFGGIPGFPLLRACAGFVDWIALRTRAISEAFEAGAA